MDELWAEGWRHFGAIFFRYRRWDHAGRHYTVTPLRVDLSRFAPSRSQRRVLARNRDLRVEVRPTEPDREMKRMFENHRRRFREEVPDSLQDFLSHAPATVPCRNETICVYEGGRLIAAHFLDLGRDSTSSVYAMFDPAESRRSLGIHTMLLAIDYSRSRGCRYYYPGYACREPSLYDYKKKFAGLEYYDWRGSWLPLQTL
jgi:arginine-tRNA-protein transferase